MKTTLELEDDVAARLKSVAQAIGIPFEKVLNDAVREGLPKVAQNIPIKAKPFRQKTQNLGIYPHIDYSKTSALLAEMEVEAFLQS